MPSLARIHRVVHLYEISVDIFELKGVPLLSNLKLHWYLLLLCVTKKWMITVANTRYILGIHFDTNTAIMCNL